MNELPSYLDGLNPQQLDAVLHGSDPLLILAGAGSGKTRVITMRVAYLVNEMKVDPSSILAVTFTNKASREMQERISHLVGEESKVMIRTFHSFCAWFLRRNSHHIGVSSYFVIYDDDDVISLLKTLYPALPKSEHRQLARWISRAKDDGLTPGDDLSAISYDPDFPNIYKTYQDKLDSIGNLDFGDLILKTVLLLRNNDAVRTRVQQRFSTILVDEYQDSNGAQYQLLHALTGKDTSLCVVGDDDQSIYRFRGAEVKNILTFPNEFDNTKIIRLEQNYRSSETILNVASSVVAHNQGRLGKTLWTENGVGEKCSLHYLDSHDEEAQLVCSIVDADGQWGNTAVLYRTNAQSRSFESALTRMGIPYRIIGSLRFYDREEIKDTIAFLSLLANPRDEVAFQRIINKPTRGLGPASVAKIIDAAYRYEGDLIEASSFALGILKGKAVKGLEAFLRLYKQWVEDMELLPLSDLIMKIIEQSGLLDYHKNQDEITGSGKEENLKELVNASAVYDNGQEGLALFLEHIELDRVDESEEDNIDRLTLITMHNTKGLEFDRVIITGMEQGLFPRDEDDPEEMEEERRLFYVAITRARKKLILTTCKNRMLHGKFRPSLPSPFLDEIPSEYIEVYGESTASAGKFQTGSTIYHDDYGVGMVIKRQGNGKDTVLVIRFESGKVAQFIEEFAPIEQIGSWDY
ncbi:ATP-dependent helicase [Spirochaeta cellobiosiphila]|uniref:ATP-dependent helicase n=1 Tax=Spirochaeta cellobiosiphila TaxID=504483 RepID=UPI000406EEBA|nr:UvrD-helicase domain-containing protein [Spirochaeta cellobiosiphila]